MRWRSITFGDLKVCLDIFPKLFGNVSRNDRDTAWRILLALPSFQGVIIEAESEAGEWTVVGSGASVFIRDDFAERAIRSPQIGLTGRIIASLLSPDPVTLSTRAIARANGSDGITVVTLWGRWARTVRSKAAIQEIRQLLAESFTALHLGFYFKSILFEMVDEQDRSFALETRLCNVVDYPSNQEGIDPGALAVVDAAKVLALPGSVLGRLFIQRRPVLNLRPPDQELLLAALDGAPDRELTERLNLKLPAVKRRWASLYRHLMDDEAAILSAGALSENGARGIQKRHEVLSYVRSHPEELRPFS